MIDKGIEEIPGKLVWLNGSDIVLSKQDLRGYLIPGQMIRQDGPAKMCPWCVVVAVGEKEIRIAEPYAGRTAACMSLREKR